MRTKTLVLTAALSLAGMAASLAQVYSANVVGYVNVKCPARAYSLIANQLTGTNLNINTVIPNAPDESTLMKWGGTGFLAADTAMGGVWYDADENPSSTTLAPGQAAFFFNGAATEYTITFVGDVTQGTNLTVNLAAGYSMVSSIVPQSAGLSTMGFTGVVDMVYLPWNKVTQGYGAASTYVGVSPEIPTGWIDGDENPTDPKPEVGDGFFISSPSAVVWKRDFVVN